MEIISNEENSHNANRENHMLDNGMNDGLEVEWLRKWSTNGQKELGYYDYTAILSNVCIKSVFTLGSFSFSRFGVM